MLFCLLCKRSAQNRKKQFVLSPVSSASWVCSWVSWRSGAWAPGGSPSWAPSWGTVVWGVGKEGKTYVSKERETKLGLWDDFPGFPSLSTLFNFNYSAAAAERGRGRNVCCIITRPSKRPFVSRAGEKKPLLDLEKHFLKKPFCVRKVKQSGKVHFRHRCFEWFFFLGGGRGVV